MRILAMTIERTDETSVAMNKHIEMADFGQFIQDTWKAPDKRFNQALAVGKAMLQGGCEMIVDEAQHHPERLMERGVVAVTTGALFGAALACETPVIAAAATVGGAIMSGMWLGELGHKLYTDSGVRKDLDSIWKDVSLKDDRGLRQKLGPDGRDLMFATTFGAAGISAGGKIPGVLKSLKSFDVPPSAPSMLFATAGDTVVQPARQSVLKPRESENVFAMSANDNVFNSSGSSPRPNKHHLEDIADIRGAIERNDLHAAEEQAFFSKICIDAFNQGIKELDDASRLFGQVEECLRQATMRGADGRGTLVNESLKKLEQLEKIDVERGQEEAARKEAEWLRSSLDDDRFANSLELDRMLGFDKDKTRSGEREEPKRSSNSKYREEDERASERQHSSDYERERTRDYDRGYDFGR